MWQWFWYAVEDLVHCHLGSYWAKRALAIGYCISGGIIMVYIEWGERVRRLYKGLRCNRGKTVKIITLRVHTIIPSSSRVFHWFHGFLLFQVGSLFRGDLLWCWQFLWGLAPLQLWSPVSDWPAWQASRSFVIFPELVRMRPDSLITTPLFISLPPGKFFFFFGFHCPYPFLFQRLDPLFTYQHVLDLLGHCVPL